MAEAQSVVIGMGPRRLSCGCEEYTPGVGRHTRIRMRPRCRKRFLAEAHAAVADFAIDWSHYEPPQIQGLDECEHRDGLVLAVYWPLKGNPSCGVILSRIFWDEATGAILQCGTNYGCLVR